MLPKEYNRLKALSVKFIKQLEPYSADTIHNVGPVIAALKTFSEIGVDESNPPPSEVKGNKKKVVVDDSGSSDDSSGSEDTVGSDGGAAGSGKKVASVMDTASKEPVDLELGTKLAVLDAKIKEADTLVKSRKDKLAKLESQTQVTGAKNIKKQISTTKFWLKKAEGELAQLMSHKRDIS